MTTGSWDRSYSYPGFNYFESKSWAGADRVKAAYIPAEIITVVRDGKTYRIRKRGSTSRPPKRAYDEPHNFVMSHSLFRDRVITYENNNGDVSTVFQSFYVGANHLDGSTWDIDTFDANDQIALIAKLREKLFGSDFNMSVFLGEGHQTLNLIADAATKIAKSLKLLKKGNLLGAAAALGVSASGLPRGARNRNPFQNGEKISDKVLSNMWLELQYGWKPLLKDTEAAAQALAKHLEVPFSKRFTVVKRKERTSTITAGGATPLDRRYNYTLTSEERRKITVYITEKPGIAAQLGLLNPENVAWELLPWSFVIDWFIPIGSYLDARAISSCISGTYVTSNKIAAKRTGLQGHIDGGGFEHRMVRFARNVSSSLDVPLPKFKGLREVASWQHCANAIALLSPLRTGR